MRSILAYIIVILVSQFCSLAGALGTAMFGVLLFFIPERLRVPLVTFLGGIGGSLLAVGFAYLIFNEWILDESFGVAPFLAVSIPLAIPIYNDYRKAHELNGLANKLPERVASYVSPDVAGLKMFIIGEIVGIAIGAALFL